MMPDMMASGVDFGGTAASVAMKIPMAMIGPESKSA